jgi:hypothetical protein
MKTIEYKAVYQSPTGHIVDNIVQVTARDINSGFRMAVSRALKDCSKRWEIVRVEFQQVTS